MDTHGDAGKVIEKKITVFTNDPLEPIKKLSISGRVYPPAKIEPKAARLFGDHKKDVSATVRITPWPFHPFEITGARAESGKYIEFTLRKEDAEGEKSNSYVIVVKNTAKKRIRFTDKIILTTTSDIAAQIEIRVFGIIR